MASIHRKNSSFGAVSWLALLLVIALSFQPLQAADPECPTGKTRWPELVGVPGCQAAAMIKAENASYNPIVIPQNTSTPKNYDCTRVFVRIAEYQGLVSDIPFAG